MRRIAEAWLADAGCQQVRVRLGIIGTHGLFGERAVLCAGRHMSTVRAKDHVVTLKIPASVFTELVRENPDFGLLVLRRLAGARERTWVVSD